MKSSSVLTQTVCLGLLTIVGSIASGQAREEATMRDAITVLNEIMAIPANGIPLSMLNNAHGVAIIPGVLKGSFVIGARHGNGVVMIRDGNGGWHAPVFITLTGGNIGWQVGVQSTDVVLVFRTRNSVEGLLAGRMTLGADAAVAAGPIGRQATAATDSRLDAQIFSYSRSRGLFAGVSFDGSVIRLNQISNASFYQAATPGGPVIIPPVAQQLGMLIIQYAGNQAPVPTQAPANGQVPVQQATATANQQILAQQHSIREADHLREQLARLAPEMYELLDANWQQFLGLPAEVFQGNSHPSIDILNQALSRFETVRNDPRYAGLANRAEFQSTYGLLKHYIQALSSNNQSLNLPAPPTIPVGSRQ